MNKLYRIYYVLFTLVMALYAIGISADNPSVSTMRDSSKVSRSAISNNILYISSYNTDSRNTAVVLETFVKRCGEVEPSRHVIIESMQCSTLKELHDLKGRMKSILGKYVTNGHAPALVVLIGREAVSSFLSLEEPEYKKLPVAIGSCSTNIVLLPNDTVDYHDWMPISKNLRFGNHDFNIIGGVLAYFDVERNIQLVRKLYPNINDFCLVTDNSLGGVTMQALVRDRVKKIPGIRMNYIDGRNTSYSGMLTKVRKMPANTALLLGTWRVDCNDNFMMSNSSNQIREANPNLPVFTLSGVGMDNLAIGGYYPDFRHDGERLADICMAYLEKFEPQSLVYVPNNANFDYRRIMDLKLSKNDLPKDSNVLNAPVSFIEEYKEWFIGVGILAIVLGLSQMITLHFMVRLRRMKEELQKQSEELIIAKDRAEESNRMKSAFLANMSHEIRTPLNSIVGFSNLLTSDQLELSMEEKAHFSEIIKQNSDALLTLINDVLDLSRIETGRMSVMKADCDVVSLSKSVLESMMVTCSKPLSFEFKCDKDELVISTDEARLRQVLVNLFTNSIKFSEQGTITLSIEEKSHKGLLYFSVSDNGCGIPKEDAKRVFERFVKLDQFKQGTGIGLQLCQQIITRLGGKIWVDTTYDNGARFVFTHPL